MNGESLTRRRLLGSFGLLALTAPLLQACASSGGSGGSGAAPAPTSSASTAGQATPASQAAPAGGTVNMSVAIRTEANNQWQKHFADQWASKHPEVKLEIDQIAYNDMAKKQLAEIATNTLQDVVYSGIKWYPYSAAKGVFLQLDEMVKANDPGMDDFIPAAITGCKFEGKLFALPSELQTGNHTQIAYNKDLLAAKGIKEPTDDWNVQDFVTFVSGLTDKNNGVFGTDYFPGSYYDFAALARTWGGDVISEDGKKFTIASDPKALAAAQWATELRTKYHAAPPRSQDQGINFPAGKVAAATVGIYSILSLGQTVGNKFKWDAVLFPKGMDGHRGYEGFVVMWSIGAKSKVPDKALDLIVLMTSQEAGIWSVLNMGYQPNGRKSVWADPQVRKVSTIFERTLAWMESSEKGPFPMPYNLRFSELEDKYENVSFPVWYGETDFKQGLDKVQSECQAIMDQARP